MTDESEGRNSGFSADSSKDALGSSFARALTAGLVRAGGPASGVKVFGTSQLALMTKIGTAPPEFQSEIGERSELSFRFFLVSFAFFAVQSRAAGGSRSAASASLSPCSPVLARGPSSLPLDVLETGSSPTPAVNENSDSRLSFTSPSSTDYRHFDPAMEGGMAPVMVRAMFSAMIQAMFRAMSGSSAFLSAISAFGGLVFEVRPCSWHAGCLCLFPHIQLLDIQVRSLLGPDLGLFHCHCRHQS